jgi:hypothetical protein
MWIYVIIFWDRTLDGWTHFPLLHFSNLVYAVEQIGYCPEWVLCCFSSLGKAANSSITSYCS